ncbi:type 2 DNA topoisomerase 6 subunit B-like [Canna indica]|uniref:Type 2 DNA topoisomerase 6 subunit B-like n=1 Tax=Canna indica TaxID=4628 RepID=A0AAQ3KXQ1_9LILI|nr:type 2 DNA topoisomerase 6 subunit B-like [Canna indica]
MVTGFTSSTRKLFGSLTYLAIQRCRMAESLCRLSISIKCFRASDSPLMRISISDTGVGSSLAEFLDLDVGIGFVSPDKCDGVLSIVTTGIKDKDIFNYYLNLREPLTSDSRFNKLPSTHKNHGTFSGTEACFSTAEEENIDDFMAWVFPFVQKNVAVDLKVEHRDSLGSRYDHLMQETDDIYLPLSMSNTERLLSSLQTYVLRHRNSLVKECQLCFTSRELLKFGSGVASSNQTVRGSGRIVEVAIVIADVSSDCLWRKNCATSQVMYFQEFAPFSISQSTLNALTSTDWQSYGLKLKESTVDADGNAVLEWEEMPLFGHIDIIIHCYHKKYPILEQTSADRNLIKKAVKIALDDLKARYPGFLLSYHALKIRKHVPSLSRTIAGLIFSSKDLQFHSECASLLGLQSDDACTEEMVESSVSKKIIKIIEVNDGKMKIDKGSGPSLFDCDQNQLDDHYPEEKDENFEEAMRISDI